MPELGHKGVIRHGEERLATLLALGDVVFERGRLLWVQQAKPKGGQLIRKQMVPRFAAHE